MTWTRLDEDVTHHPKILSITPFAELVHYRALVYCNRLLTDGHIRPSVPPLLMRGIDETVAIREHDGELFSTWGTPTADELVEELLQAGLWERNGHGWKIHDFAKYQPLRSDVEAKREQARAAAKIGGIRSAALRSARYGTSAPLNREIPKRTPKRVALKRHEVPPKSEPEPEPEPEPVVIPKGITSLGGENWQKADSLCQLLGDLIEANGSQRPEGKRWAEDAERMLRLDGRDAAEAEVLIRWTQASDFWRANILSMSKFRQKYDTLRLQRQREQPTVSARLREWAKT